MENSKIVTIEKLNQAYIKLIKMVLNGTYSANTPYINSFYHDPSPDDAYTLLNKILNEDSQAKKDSEYGQGSGKKFQLKRAVTTGFEDKDYGGKGNDDLNELNVQIKSNAEKGKKNYQFNPTAKEVENGNESKTDRLKRITAKITGIFSNNHKKILKYQQISKYSGASPTQLKFAKPSDMAFKKY